jgi:hypothetical protein
MDTTEVAGSPSFALYFVIGLCLLLIFVIALAGWRALRKDRRHRYRRRL